MSLLVIASPTLAQSWLLGQRQSEAEGQIKVRSRYREGNKVRAYARGGPFDRVDKVGDAALRRLAEMARDKDMPKFLITKEQCWQQLFGAADCVLEAQMFSADELIVEARAGTKLVSVADILVTQ